MLQRFIPHILIVLAILSFIGGVYLKGRGDCKLSAVVKEQSQTIKDTEVLNEIRNTRPDDAGLLGSLRSGKF